VGEVLLRLESSGVCDSVAHRDDEGVSAPDADNEALGIHLGTTEPNPTKRRIDMNEATIVAARYEEKVLSALRHLRNGNIEDALAEFAEEFCFTDRALGLEFTDRERLREFLLKERELYSGSSFQVKKSVVAEDHVIAEWLLQYMVKERFYGSSPRDVPVSVQGVSVVRTREGKVTAWSDYYDGLISI
jgi:ketosteroid isomerase-like protein